VSKVPAVDKLDGSPSTGDRRSPVSCAPWLAHSGNGGAIAFDLDPNLIDASVLSSSRAVEQELAALRQDRDALQRGFLEAARVQQRLGAPRHFRRGAFDIAGEMFPIEHVSGDFLTAFDAGSHTVLGVGDIAGKGLSAGMWFTHLVGLVRLFAGSLDDPAAVAAAINRHLASLGPEAPMTTLFLTWVDARAGRLVYSNAGHPAPFVLRRDSSLGWLDAGGPVLGAFPDATFVNGSAALNPGDTLLGFSDGILECRNTQGEEFGVERLVDAARSALSPSASATLFSVLGSVQDFAAAEPRVDDLALMVVHRVDAT